MNCKLCGREARDYEFFHSLHWSNVDEEEYKKRKKEGRAILITEVCSDCVEKHTNRPPLSLTDLNEIRKRGISQDQYYKEHGYE